MDSQQYARVKSILARLTTANQIWLLAQQQIHDGTPENAWFWQAVKMRSDQDVRDLEYDLGALLPSGFYMHRRTERRP